MQSSDKERTRVKFQQANRTTFGRRRSLPDQGSGKAGCIVPWSRLPIRFGGAPGSCDFHDRSGSIMIASCQCAACRLAAMSAKLSIADVTVALKCLAQPQDRPHRSLAMATRGAERNPVIHLPVNLVSSIVTKASSPRHGAKISITAAY
jgi:hypothetical protein